MPAALATLASASSSGLGVLVAWLRTRSEAGTAGPKRLAVLPFENLGRPEDGYFADGVTDEVRGKLAALPGLEVIASTSSSQYKATPRAPRQIGAGARRRVPPHRHGALGKAGTPAESGAGQP